MPFSDSTLESAEAALPRSSTAAAADAVSQPGEQVNAGSRTPADLDVSVVMPCLNEQDAVAECVQKARGWIGRSGLTGEVIVVDNGSTDNSAAEAERAGARVIHHSEKGYGNALQRGFSEARGRSMCAK